MTERITVTIDFRACRYISELYRELRTKLDWEDDYGESLDALWDILWGMPHKGDDFTIVRPLYFQNIPGGQGQRFTEYVDKICNVFRRAEQQGFVRLKIEYSNAPIHDLSDYLL